MRIKLTINVDENLLNILERVKIETGIAVGSQLELLSKRLLH